MIFLVSCGRYSLSAWVRKNFLLDILQLCLLHWNLYSTQNWCSCKAGGRDLIFTSCPGALCWQPFPFLWNGPATSNIYPVSTQACVCFCDTFFDLLSHLSAPASESTSQLEQPDNNLPMWWKKFPYFLLSSLPAGIPSLFLVFCSYKDILESACQIHLTWLGLSLPLQGIYV